MSKTESSWSSARFALSTGPSTPSVSDFMMNMRLVLMVMRMVVMMMRMMMIMMMIDEHVEDDVDDDL